MKRSVPVDISVGDQDFAGVLIFFEESKSKLTIVGSYKKRVSDFVEFTLDPGWNWSGDEQLSGTTTSGLKVAGGKNGSCGCGSVLKKVYTITDARNRFDRAKDYVAKLREAEALAAEAKAKRKAQRELSKVDRSNRAETRRKAIAARRQAKIDQRKKEKEEDNNA